MNVFQFNKAGIQSKKEELGKALIDNDVHIALIQENILSKWQMIKFPYILILEQDMDSTPTLLHKVWRTERRPDLTLISAEIYEKTTVEVKDNLGGDHLPLLIKIASQKKI